MKQFLTPVSWSVIPRAVHYVQRQHFSWFIPYAALSSNLTSSLGVQQRSGVIVELRAADSQHLLGFGFSNSVENGVEVVHRIDGGSGVVWSVPSFSNEEMESRLAACLVERTNTLDDFTTVARLIHGVADGFPSLYVDRFEGHAMVLCFSEMAAKMAATAVPLLLASGVHFVSVVDRGKRYKYIPVSKDSTSLDTYSYLGCHFPTPNLQRPDARCMPQLQYVMQDKQLRVSAVDKRCLLLGDDMGQALCQILMVAKTVAVLLPQSSGTDRCDPTEVLMQSVALNFSSQVLKHVQFVSAEENLVQLGPFDFILFNQRRPDETSTRFVRGSFSTIQTIETLLPLLAAQGTVEIRISSNFHCTHRSKSSPPLRSKDLDVLRDKFVLSEIFDYSQQFPALENLPSPFIRVSLQKHQGGSKPLTE